VLGIVIGTAILVMLPNLTNLLGVPSELEFIVIGGALLVGAIMDELLRPRSAAQLSA
jgi:ribose transport system permease protein